jgi:hypothetical protein
MSGKIVRTTNITQSAVGNKDGLWTTVFAAAVFINDDNLSFDAEKSATVNSKAPLQEDILRQTLQGQFKNAQATDKLVLRNREPDKSAVEQTRPIPSTKKILS